MPPKRLIVLLPVLLLVSSCSASSEDEAIRAIADCHNLYNRSPISFEKNMLDLNLKEQMAFAFGLFYPIDEHNSNIDWAQQRIRDALAASAQRDGTKDVSVRFCKELGKITFDVMIAADKNVDPAPAFLRQFHDLREPM